jgi:hypothetical protein
MPRKGYNPSQPRDPGGKDGGRWVKAAARTVSQPTLTPQEKSKKLNELERKLAAMEVAARKKPMTKTQRRKYDDMKEEKYRLSYSPVLSRQMDPRRYSEKNQED